ncbi:MAG: bifunctional 2-polyprenyl-6-hydroxyphenol methylase/3-demethylubiquinol 3-O-methyltransferase UbiG [SAR86 cluster bacterium]|jgi:2-polyprenyl-6-hydroxyphenyl methylase/3-demethylubiquinone-9 3-methyltransferase|nr:bifunctional 2-polyprenyl-6-hydroxyphenol methylase/3-demethylubiquinol 3-O-methyltransferase UbiG [SAR86 cluster bacterium]|tara:strand:+ start:129 stop:833 length:705 start_codon:yes stop_codon:yes gene_type:complete
MTQNIDTSEVEKFADLAERWWDPKGEFKPLHIINPLRAEFIASRVDLKNMDVLDVGCGGGLLCEALFDFNGKISGIDAAGPGIEIAKRHAKDNCKEILYRDITAEELVDSESEKYDVVTCLEVIEHVPDPQSLVTACSNLLKPGGSLFLSTINRNPRSWITAIVGAEYIFNILPKGTHEFSKFIKPSELASCMRTAGINLSETKGMFYNPLTHKANLNNDLGVNYLMYGKKPKN